MFDDEITLLCFFNSDSIHRINETFPNMDESNMSLLHSYFRDGIVPVVVKHNEVINPKSEDNIKKQKEELKKRFCYIYENSYNLLEKYSYPIQNHLGYNFMIWLEEFLLGNKPIEETEFYKYVEKKKSSYNKIDINTSSDKEHLIWNIAKVKGDRDFYTWQLLSHLVCFIKSRKEIGSYNNIRELEALDEYFRILRYSNDGIEWESGYELCGVDLMHSLFLIQAEREEVITYCDSPEFGGNEFISCFASDVKRENVIKLSEKEKQEIYLKYHDELPWDLALECKSDDELERPDGTTPCGSILPIKEEDIFIGDNKKYYCMCRDCGYIISIPEGVLTDNIRNNISDRCSRNKDLFRKMMIYSELQALDRDSSDDRKILVKKENKNETYGFSYIMSRFKNKGGK